EAALAQLDAPTRGGADILTFYALARRSVSLFWPLVAAPAGFAHPEREPTFLTIETAQYFVWRIVAPLMAHEGYFAEFKIRRERLLSQLVDNLNKSALVGFSHTDIYARLKGAWTGAAEHLNGYWQAQDCAIRFRDLCLAHELVDFSLVMELYSRYLLTHPVYQRFFRARYRQLLVDNVEENVPIAHDMIAWAAPGCDATVLASDTGGGYRIFLGADAQGAAALRAACHEVAQMAPLAEGARHALAFAANLRAALRAPAQQTGLAHAAGQTQPHELGEPQRAIADQGWGRYWISMIRWIAERIAALVAQGVPAGEIAVIAPYVSEVMRFAIEEELRAHGVALYLLRPSMSLRDDPTVRGLLILALLAHPHWELTIGGEPYRLGAEDATLALQVALDGLDPIRARQLAASALPAAAALPANQRTLADLSGGAEGPTPQREIGRLWQGVGFSARQPYETLRVWLETYRGGAPEPLDLFLSRLFGDLLSRPGYGLCQQPAAARALGRLVESARKFRTAVGEVEGLAPDVVAREYVQLILAGIASAEYVADRPLAEREDAVVLAPAYAYLTRDLRSAYQFWIDLGSDGWWNRPNQPLTHPYVLSRRWPVGQPWRDIEEEQAKREALGRIVEGLAARCTRGIYLAYCELGLDGSEQGGRLQRAIAATLARMRPQDAAQDAAQDATP
ncbi:MAG: hypothetical protein V1772_01835, partial [Chloroflexota bacterium]